MSKISNLEDISRINYSEDWLPPYDELRQELVTTWKQYEKRRKEQGKHPRGGVTSMPILDGHAQPGPGVKRCYGCGALGHIRGDPKCTAGGTAVWKGAPEGFKRKIDGGSKNPYPQKKGGKGKGGATQRNYLATIGQGEMASASLQIIVDTAIVDQKEEVEGARR